MTAACCMKGCPAACRSCEPLDNDEAFVRARSLDVHNGSHACSIVATVYVNQEGRGTAGQAGSESSPGARRLSAKAWPQRNSAYARVYVSVPSHGRLFHKYVAGYVPPGVRQMIEPPTTKHFRWPLPRLRLPVMSTKNMTDHDLCEVGKLTIAGN